jgi:hypothetical protein
MLRIAGSPDRTKRDSDIPLHIPARPGVEDREGKAASRTPPSASVEVHLLDTSNEVRRTAAGSAERNVPPLLDLAGRIRARRRTIEDSLHGNRAEMMEGTLALRSALRDLRDAAPPKLSDATPVLPSEERCVWKGCPRLARGSRRLPSSRCRPIGFGKTFTASRIIDDLALRTRIGVTANSPRRSRTFSRPSWTRGEWGITAKSSRR